MIYLALIKKNDYFMEFSELEDHYNKPSNDLVSLKEKIKDSIKDLVEFIEIEDNSLLEHIVSNLDYQHNDQLDTDTILETNKNVFQVCYKLKEDLDNNNHLATLLSRKIKFGNAIFIGYEYKNLDDIERELEIKEKNKLIKKNEDNPQEDKIQDEYQEVQSTCYNLCSITLDNIVDILLDKIYSQCVFCKSNKEMIEPHSGQNTNFAKQNYVEYRFRNINELSNTLFGTNDINKYEIECGGFKLDIYEKKNNDDKPNILATRLVGECVVKGDVIIVCTIGDNILGQISIPELKQIEKIATCSMDDRKEKTRWVAYILACRTDNMALFYRLKSKKSQSKRTYD